VSLFFRAEWWPCDWRTRSHAQLCIFGVASLMITSDPCPWLHWCLTNCRIQMKFPGGCASWTHIWLIVTVWYFSYLVSLLWPGRAPKGGYQPALPPRKSELKKHRFCRHDDVKHFMWFSVHRKLATEIGWWLVHWKFEI